MLVVHRAKDNPVLLPVVSHPWEAMATFNWCPAEVGSATYCIYRAMTLPEQMLKERVSWSSIGSALLPGPCVVQERRQFIKPVEEWERYGCEDPRVMKFEGRYYIFYTALSTFPFNADGIKVAVAISDDLKKVAERHLVTPFNAKAMALFPERVDGKIAVILSVNTDRPPTYLAVALVDQIEQLWDPERWDAWYKDLERHTINATREVDDHVEVGAAPVKTKQGWLLIYSHIQHYHGDRRVFGVEALLLDEHEPTKIIGRTRWPIMVAEELYEKIGHVGNLIFPSGAVKRDKWLDIYYGATDTVGCRASVRLDYLIDSLLPRTPQRRLVHRFEGNPILEPIAGHSWENKGVFNPGAIELDGKIHILYRALSNDDTSTIGYAVSTDGFRIEERLPEPIYTPRADFEVKKRPGNSGCEDQRIVQVGDKLYITYTAYNGQDPPRVAVSSITVDDFLARKWNWSAPQVISPMDMMDKNSCILPEKVDGKYMLMHRINNEICADHVSSLDFTQEKLDSCLQVMQPRAGMWDSQKVGISAPPIKIPEGWLLIYHGVSDKGEYRLGAALLDGADPTLVLARCALPIFEPEEKYEKEGIVPNVVFPCGAVLRGDTVFIYYGGADKVVGVATMSLAEVLQRLMA